VFTCNLSMFLILLRWHHNTLIIVHVMYCIEYILYQLDLLLNVKSNQILNVWLHVRFCLLKGVFVFWLMFNYFGWLACFVTMFSNHVYVIWFSWWKFNDKKCLSFVCCLCCFLFLEKKTFTILATLRYIVFFLYKYYRKTNLCCIKIDNKNQAVTPGLSKENK